MKTLITAALVMALSGCGVLHVHDDAHTHEPVASEQTTPPYNICHGTTDLPPQYAGMFDAITDDTLLQSALGEPNKGMLCQGQVYQAKQNINVTLYRAWNSTNPNSRLGKWWAFNQPDGMVAKYRSEFEICYQWSPLDSMVECTLDAGTKVVVGTGQSAECSQYLTYPVSASKQVYIQDASASVANCKDYNGVFDWQAAGN